MVATKTLWPISVVLLLTLAGLMSANAQINEPVEPLDNFVLNGDFEITREALPMGEEVCEAFGDDIWFPPEPLPALVVLSCNVDQDRPVHWSHHDDTLFGDFTGDGGTQARLGGAAGHNMWQAYPSPHQAFSARMDSYDFEVAFSSLDDGDGRWQVPNSASIKLSLSTSPAETAHPFVVAFFECELMWRGSVINDAIDGDGLVQLKPLDGTFNSRSSECDDAKQAWDDGDDEEKLDVLGRLRLVQNSFWNFNSGGNVVVVDNIASSGSTLAPLEIAAGNHDL